MVGPSEWPEMHGYPVPCSALTETREGAFVPTIPLACGENIDVGMVGDVVDVNPRRDFVLGAAHGDEVVDAQRGGEDGDGGGERRGPTGPGHAAATAIAAATLRITWVFVMGLARSVVKSIDRVPAAAWG